MILKCLSERAGETVGREEILDKVWGFEVFPSTRTIDNFIVRLRKRFERDPEAPVFFHTVRGVGIPVRRRPVPAPSPERQAHDRAATTESNPARAHGSPTGPGFMRQAGRYLPEYQALAKRPHFQGTIAVLGPWRQR